MEPMTVCCLSLLWLSLWTGHNKLPTSSRNYCEEMSPPAVGINGTFQEVWHKPCASIDWKWNLSPEQGILVLNDVVITWTKRLAVYKLVIKDGRLVDFLCSIYLVVRCYNSSCSSFILKLRHRDHRPNRLPTNKEVYVCLYSQRRIIRNNWTTF